MISILGMIGYGVAGAVFDFLPEAPYEPHPPGLEGIGLFLFLRAFSAGCTALTESRPCPTAFRVQASEAINASKVMLWLGGISVAMFLGITYLAYDFGIVPGGEETVVSKIAAAPSEEVRSTT